jgi:hypothetical protein
MCRIDRILTIGFMARSAVQLQHPGQQQEYCHGYFEQVAVSQTAMDNSKSSDSNSASSNNAASAYQPPPPPPLPPGQGVRVDQLA